MLFHNLQGKNFENVPAVEGTGLADVIAGRGMAVGDLVQRWQNRRSDQRDGRPPGPVAQREPGSQSLAGTEACRRPARSPRDAVGTTVYVTANGMKQRGDVISGGSYLSSQRSCARTSASARRRRSTTSRFTGPAARWSTSPCPASTASSPSAKATVSKPA